MTRPPRPLDAPMLLARLRACPFVNDVRIRGQVDSTNDVARELSERGAPDGTVVVAEGQSAGRGRLGRRWHSPRGTGLYLSVLLRPTGRPARLTRWTIGAGLAAAEACRRTAGVEARIRWPNDLLWGSAKLGGVLVEMRSRGAQIRELIVGVGINVHQRADEFPDDVAGQATSLHMATDGRPPTREVLAACLVERLGSVADHLQRGAWSDLARRWLELAPGARGRRVRVCSRESGQPGREGVTSGLDDCGALRVRDDAGNERAIRLVESVRELEG